MSVPLPVLLATSLIGYADPTCADLAAEANRYIRMGRAKAVRELSEGKGRTDWICRMVFQQKPGGKPLRAQALGALSLPHNSMPLEDWPEWPLAQSHGVWFVLADGYQLAGLPEHPADYVRYCDTEGAFRTKPFPIPTSAEAKSALEALLASPRWKAIRWRDSGERWNSVMSPSTVIDYLKPQTALK